MSETDHSPIPPLPPFRTPLALWALTGALEDVHILRALDSFNEANWGIVIYPRWGLEVEYLSERWFEKVRFIVEEAALRNMEVWLYDEFCWPSGHAKGLVTKNASELEAEILEVNATGRSRRYRIPGSANLLSREATERFLNITHDRYEAAVGQYFGTTVRAIFTDEPSLPYIHEGRGPSGAPWRLLWSSAMDERLGPDFHKRLLSDKNVVGSPLWREYWRAYTDLFHSNWIRPISQWCQSHDLLLTGHLLGEDTFGDQILFNGSLKRQLREFGIPGIDEIRTEVEPSRCEALTLATIAEFEGQERMAEVFALGPASMSLDRMRTMVDLCASCGVNRFVHALAPLDFRGNKLKSEYFSVFGPQQPWFKNIARDYSKYCVEAALKAELAQPLGIPFPSDETLWDLAGPDPSQSIELQNITDKFVEEARQIIKSRLEKPRSAIKRIKKTDTSTRRWRFRPDRGNSLRLDGSALQINELPSFAELSLQRQLVTSVRVNGCTLNLDQPGSVDPFDNSYIRHKITPLLRLGINEIIATLSEPGNLDNLPSLILWGDFTVNPSGALEAGNHEIDAGDWRERGYPSFCGIGHYEGKIECCSDTSILEVDSGGFPTRLVVNNIDCGWRAWEPFHFDVSNCIRVGENSISIEIASTVGHLFTPKESRPIGLMGIKCLSGEGESKHYGN